jgi:hypothetical protein
MKTLILLWCCVASTVLAQSQNRANPVRFAGLPPSDSGAPNDCLPAAMRVYHELPGPPTCAWKRLLSARYPDGRLHHTYCVFTLGLQVYAYDSQWGSRPVFPADRSVTAMVRAVDFRATHGVYLDRQDPPKAKSTATTKTKSKSGSNDKKSAKKSKSKTPDRRISKN